MSSLGPLVAYLEQKRDSSSELKTLLSAGLDTLQNSKFPEEGFSYIQALELLNRIAEWIVSHSSSQSLTNMIEFVVGFLYFLGYRAEYRVEFEAEPENKELKTVISNNFVSCLLSLINSILQSKNITKYSKILFNLLSISVMLITQSAVASAFRRKGTLKQLIIMIKEVVKAGNTDPLYVQVIASICILVAKLANRHSKCREYLIRKSCVQILLNIVNPNGPYSDNHDLHITAFYAIGSLTGTNDNQLLIWVSGGVTILLHWFNVHYPKMDSSLTGVLYGIWKLAVDNEEIQCELQAGGVLEKCLEVLASEQLTKNTEIYCICILRRLCSNPQYKAELTPKCLTLFIEKLKKFSRRNNTFALKEISAALGSVSTVAEICEKITDSDCIEILLESCIRNIDSTRYVKTTVGALVNFSLYERNRDRIANNSNFYTLASQVLMKYISSAFILDYILRLILNAIAHSNCLYHFSTDTVIDSCVKVMQRFKTDENLTYYALQILKTIVNFQKGHEVFIDYAVSSSYDFVDIMLDIMTAFKDNLVLVTESVYFISNLAKSSDTRAQNMVSKNSNLVKGIQMIIKEYENKEDSMMAISEAIATLPIEDFDLLIL